MSFLSYNNISFTHSKLWSVVHIFYIYTYTNLRRKELGTKNADKRTGNGILELVYIKRWNTDESDSTNGAILFEHYKYYDQLTYEFNRMIIIQNA